MKILRRPEHRFASLPDYPYAPNYLEVAPGLRMHYVEAGPSDAPPVLLMHGEPTWSYLYRHMIPRIAAAGLRAIAPDLIGFGLSDKPASTADYSYAAHVGWVRRWVEALDLRGVTMVGQDWGSLVGLRLVTEMPERFERIVLSNGGLPEGTGAPKAFRHWRAFSRWSPLFPIGRIVQAGTRRRLSPAEVAAYDAPFPARRYKAAARIFPTLVPVDPGNPAIPDQKRAWSVLEGWTRPFICCYSDRDPITRGAERPFLERVPGTKGQPHTTLRGGHFVQEDDPEGFSRVIVAACGR